MKINALVNSRFSNQTAPKELFLLYLHCQLSYEASFDRIRARNLVDKSKDAYFWIGSVLRG